MKTPSILRLFQHLRSVRLGLGKHESKCSFWQPDTDTFHSRLLTTHNAMTSGQELLISLNAHVPLTINYHMITARSDEHNGSHHVSELWIEVHWRMSKPADCVELCFTLRLQMHCFQLLDQKQTSPKNTEGLEPYLETRRSQRWRTHFMLDRKKIPSNTLATIQNTLSLWPWVLHGQYNSYIL